MDYVEIPLRARDGSIKAVTKVSPEDAEWLNRYRWKLTAKGYAQREHYDGQRWHSVRMHRAIMGLARGDVRQPDHINRDKLDNRRENLRVVSDAEQRQNVPGRGGASRHRGVSQHSGGGWRARVGQRQFGVFRTEEQAAAAVRAVRAALYPAAID